VIIIKGSGDNSQNSCCPSPNSQCTLPQHPIIHGNLSLKKINNKFSSHGRSKQRAVKPRAVKKASGFHFSLLWMGDGTDGCGILKIRILIIFL
jgi:hypothetical protein